MGWTFSWMLAILLFCEKTKQKKTGWKYFMLVYFEKFNTWNVGHVSKHNLD
jgi:hypothetical protein